jgi:porin
VAESDRPAPAADRAICGLALAAVLLLPLPAVAADQPEDFWHRDTLTRDWGGLRDRLGQAGVTISLDDTAELLANVRGGIRTGTVYEGLLLGQVDADLDKLLGWTGAALHVSVFNFAGRGLTQGYVGSILGVSGVEAPAPSTKIWEAYLEQKAFGDALSIRVGQWALDEDGFLVTNTAALFVGSPFGLAGGVSADLPAGGPTSPLAAPGVRVRVHPNGTLELSAAVQSGDASGGNGTTLPAESYPRGTVFSFSGGALAIAQAALKLNQGKTTFKLGGWVHTGNRFGDQLLAANLVPQSSPNAPPDPLLHHSDWGLYGSAEAMLFREPGTKDQGLSAFVLLAGSPPDQNLIDLYAHGGLTYKGPIPGRGDDRAGVAFAYAHVSPRAQALDRDAQAVDPTIPVRDRELLLEATYQAQVVPWWTMQPDLQFWFHPGGHVANADGSLRRNAVVAGVRSDITF